MAGLQIWLQFFGKLLSWRCQKEHMSVPRSVVHNPDGVECL